MKNGNPVKRFNILNPSEKSEYTVQFIVDAAHVLHSYNCGAIGAKGKSFPGFNRMSRIRTGNQGALWIVQARQKGIKRPKFLSI